MAANNAQDDIKAMMKASKTQTETLCRVMLPQEALDFDKIVQSDKHSLQRLDEVKVAASLPEAQAIEKRLASLDANDEKSGSAVYLFPGGSVPSNPLVGAFIDEVRPRWVALIEQLEELKHGILQPRPFSGINEAVFPILSDKVRAVVDDISGFLDEIGLYHVMRAKLVAKVGKYPHVQDYRIAVANMDEEQFLSLRRQTIQTRNACALLHAEIRRQMFERS